MNLLGGGNEHVVHNSYTVPGARLHIPRDTSMKNNFLYLPDEDTHFYYF